MRYFILKFSILKISWILLFLLEWLPAQLARITRAQNRADAKTIAARHELRREASGASHLVWTSTLINMGAVWKRSALHDASVASVNQALACSLNAANVMQQKVSLSHRWASAVCQVWRRHRASSACDSHTCWRVRSWDCGIANSSCAPKESRGDADAQRWVCFATFSRRDRRAMKGVVVAADDCSDSSCHVWKIHRISNTRESTLLSCAFFFFKR